MIFTEPYINKIVKLDLTRCIHITSLPNYMPELQELYIQDLNICTISKRIVSKLKVLIALGSNLESLPDICQNFKN